MDVNNAGTFRFTPAKDGTFFNGNAMAGWDGMIAEHCGKEVELQSKSSNRKVESRGLIGNNANQNSLLREIAITTGTRKHAQSKDNIMMRICDQQNNCCETSSNGWGSRKRGQTKSYTGAVLGSCGQVRFDIFNKLT